jgi:hypothetical protein
MADLGIASLLIDLPQARALPNFLHPEKDQATLVQTVLAVRRGMDCLALRSDIDMSRGAIIGFSFGVWIGSRSVGLDTRPTNRSRGSPLRGDVMGSPQFDRLSR